MGGLEIIAIEPAEEDEDGSERIPKQIAVVLASRSEGGVVQEDDKEVIELDQGVAGAAVIVSDDHQDAEEQGRDACPVDQVGADRKRIQLEDGGDAQELNQGEERPTGIGEQEEQTAGLSN